MNALVGIIGEEDAKSERYLSRVSHYIEKIDELEYAMNEKVFLYPLQTITISLVLLEDGLHVKLGMNICKGLLLRLIKCCLMLLMLTV